MNVGSVGKCQITPVLADHVISIPDVTVGTGNSRYIWNALQFSAQKKLVADGAPNGDVRKIVIVRHILLKPVAEK